MFTLLGTDAFPEFRLRQLEEAASRALGAPVSLEARWIYLLDTPAGLGDPDVVRASELLEAVGRASPREKGAVYVAPRKGTISPWSSKASDIFRSCGLGKLVRRVERAVVFRATRDGKPVAPKDPELRVTSAGPDLGCVSMKRYFADQELVRLVMESNADSGETDTAKWMTGAAKEAGR
jgi:hypothetical protein